ncbi:MAG: glutathione S-transferase N-terminal domain-containing protein [Pseudomonadota bacterium]
MFESRRPDHEDDRSSTVATPVLYVGNRATSSWSLRAWLALHLAEQPLDVVEIDLFAPDRVRRIEAVSPSGKLPVLAQGDFVIWDSMAIMEWAAELMPGLWPTDARQRAVARSVVAEIHGGLASLRSTLPMDWFATYTVANRLPANTADDIDRVLASCQALLTAGSASPFLFGDTPTLADVALVPIASRLRTYGLMPDEAPLGDYLERLLGTASLDEWFLDTEPRPALPVAPAVTLAGLDGSPVRGSTASPKAGTRAPAPAAPDQEAADATHRTSAGPKKLEDVVARARFKGPSPSHDQRPAPRTPRAPDDRALLRRPAPSTEIEVEPASNDAPTARSPRGDDQPGLPWLRRWSGRAPSVDSGRRRPPRRDK